MHYRSKNIEEKKKKKETNMKPAKYLLTFGFIYNALFLCVS